MKTKASFVFLFSILISCSTTEDQNPTEILNSNTITLTPNNLSANNCSSSHATTINSNILYLSNNGGGTLILDDGLHIINKQISVKSNVNLVINGDIEKADCSNNFFIIKVENAENVRINGNVISKINTITNSHIDNAIYVGNSKNIRLEEFSINGDPNDPSATGIKIHNSSDLNLQNINISNFRNKGISITGSNQKNLVISNNSITGSNNHSNGAGISISDSHGKVKYSEISSNYIDSCRIGITVNKSEFINVQNNSCIDNSLTGIALDGYISESGDGPKNCIVSGNFLVGNGYEGVNCSSQEYAGIYLGNGAGKNIISENIIKNNAFGISYNDFNLNTSNGAYNNTITNNQIVQNRWTGIKISNMYRSIISDNEIIQNLKGGIEFKNISAGNFLIKNNNLVLNGKYGIIFNNCTNTNILITEEDNIITDHGIQNTIITNTSISCSDL